nr:immunoglobulin light chain junction region [Macaca mulatta]
CQQHGNQPQLTF